MNKTTALFVFTILVVFAALAAANGSRATIEVNEWTQQNGWTTIEKAEISGTWQGQIKPDQSITITATGILPIHFCVYGAQQTVNPGAAHVLGSLNLQGTYDLTITTVWNNCQ